MERSTATTCSGGRRAGWLAVFAIAASVSLGCIAVEEDPGLDEEIGAEELDIRVGDSGYVWTGRSPIGAGIGGCNYLNGGVSVRTSGTCMVTFRYSNCTTVVNDAGASECTCKATAIQTQGTGCGELELDDFYPTFP